MPQDPTESPRLKALRGAGARGDSRSVERLWSRLVSGGLPLIERIPRDRARFRVTLLWRPDAPVAQPSVYTPVADVQAGEMTLLPLRGTGIWYRTFVLPRGARAMYAFSPRPIPSGPGDSESWGAYYRSLVPDPHHPTRLIMDRDPDDPKDVEVTLSVVALPGAPSQPWLSERSPSRWECHHRRLRSREMGSARSVWVYRDRRGPADGRRGNLILVFDGVVYRSGIPVPTIVQNLVDARLLAPSTIVLIGNAAHARDIELAHNPRFARFLAHELLPWLRRQYGVAPPSAHTVLAGSSLGGLMAAYAAWMFPARFGNVLAQSGAFLWSGEAGPDGPVTLMSEYARSTKRPLQFYLDAGTLETRVFAPTSMSLLASVRHMRDVLVARGYPVHYAEFVGGHDYSCWAGTFADGLLALLGPHRRPLPKGRRPLAPRAHSSRGQRAG